MASNFRALEATNRRETALLVAAFVFLVAHASAAEPGWQYYGGDQGGQRFSAGRQITSANVTSLQVAWSYSTGDMASKGDAMKRASFEDTPVLADGRLYVCSPFDEAAVLPYAIDLVRLATSALFAIAEGHLALKPKDACASILEGYK